MKIGNGSAFWGDRPQAAYELISQVEDLDYLTFDYLSEVSLSIMAVQREKNPSLGYAADFIQAVRSLKPLFDKGKKCKLISNAGGLNPLGLAQEIQKLGLKKRIFVVTGDDVIDHYGPPLTTANAYLGASGILQALQEGADIVITGRVADPSLTVAPCLYHYGWKEDDWQKIAQATVAGHLIECGTQVTGGISNDWLKWAEGADIGFPVAEVDESGLFRISKAKGTGGAVNRLTVTEQLLYEIGDPSRYLSPDVSVSFLALNVKEVGKDQVEVSGAIGSPPTDTYKVSATYRAGFKVEGMIVLYGDELERKAQLAGKRVLKEVNQQGFTFDETLVELIGGGAMPYGAVQGLREGVLRIAARSSSEEACKCLADLIAPLVTAGPAGTTGYSGGRPHVRPLFGFKPDLIEKSKVHVEVKEVLR